MKPENVKCPECDWPMVSRKSQHGVFWGCKQFPKCKGTRNADGEGRRQRFDADGEVVDTPANLSGAARALVEQWREVAKEHRLAAYSYGNHPSRWLQIGHAEGFEKSADMLSALLAQAGDQKEVDHVDRSRQCTGESAVRTTAAAVVRARLELLTEIHETWEFEDLSEAQFDGWLHQRIKALRTEVAQAGQHENDQKDLARVDERTASPLPVTTAGTNEPATNEDAVGKPDASTPGSAFAQDSSLSASLSSTCGEAGAPETDTGPT